MQLIDLNVLSKDSQSALSLSYSGTEQCVLQTVKYSLYCSGYVHRGFNGEIMLYLRSAQPFVEVNDSFGGICCEVRNLISQIQTSLSRTFVQVHLRNRKRILHIKRSIQVVNTCSRLYNAIIKQISSVYDTRFMHISRRHLISKEYCRQ